MERYQKFFGPFLDKQQQWLNQKAAEGMRLVKVGRNGYTFENCGDERYVYSVEFIGGMSEKLFQNYTKFLKQAGYGFFSKGLNMDGGLGPMRRRPFGESLDPEEAPGVYGAELLILEKEEDGLPFELSVDHAAQLDYLRRLGTMHKIGVGAGVFGSAWLVIRSTMGLTPWGATWLFVVFVLLLCIPIFQCRIVANFVADKAAQTEKD